MHLTVKRELVQEEHDTFWLNVPCIPWQGENIVSDIGSTNSSHYSLTMTINSGKFLGYCDDDSLPSFILMSLTLLLRRIRSNKWSAMRTYKLWLSVEGIYLGAEWTVKKPHWEQFNMVRGWMRLSFLTSPTFIASSGLTLRSSSLSLSFPQHTLWHVRLIYKNDSQ